MFESIRIMVEEQKEGKEKRQAVVLGICMVVLTLALLFGGEEDELSAGEMGTPATQAGHETEAIRETAAPKRILGAAKAVKSSALADPFSILHPTRKEMEQAVVPAALPVAEQAAQGTPAAPVSQEEPPESIKAPVFELKGIAKGGGGGIAILKHGEMTHSLQAGEPLGDVQVEEIGDTYVLLSNGMRLELQMP